MATKRRKFKPNFNFWVFFVFSIVLVTSVIVYKNTNKPDTLKIEKPDVTIKAKPEYVDDYWFIISDQNDLQNFIYFKKSNEGYTMFKTKYKATLTHIPENRMVKFLLYTEKTDTTIPYYFYRTDNNSTELNGRWLMQNGSFNGSLNISVINDELSIIYNMYVNSKEVSPYNGGRLSHGIFKDSKQIIFPNFEKPIAKYDLLLKEKDLISDKIEIVYNNSQLKIIDLHTKSESIYSKANQTP